jgi:monoamine oxidase
MSHKGAGEQLSNLTEWLAGAFETARIVVSRIHAEVLKEGKVPSKAGQMNQIHLPIVVT